MAGRKKKKVAYASINEKLANKKLKKIDQYMDLLRSTVGKQGDGLNGGSKTLIGAIEGLNNEAYDTKELQDAYNRFNDKTLPAFQKKVAKIDMQLNVIDSLAK